MVLSKIVLFNQVTSYLLLQIILKTDVSRGGPPRCTCGSTPQVLETHLENRGPLILCIDRFSKLHIRAVIVFTEKGIILKTKTVLPIIIDLCMGPPNTRQWSAEVAMYDQQRRRYVCCKEMSGCLAAVSS